MTDFLLTGILLILLFFGGFIAMTIADIRALLIQTNADLDALIAQGQNSVPQAQLDEAGAGIQALDDKIKGAITPP